MSPDLTDAERERFEALRQKLDGVSRPADTGPSPLTDFEPLDPMLAETYTGDLARLPEDEWIAERKFDGTRLILQQFDGEIRLYTRRHIERSEIFPDIVTEAHDTLPDGLVLDGEVTFLDPGGASFFLPIHGGDDLKAEYDLTPRYVVFDILVEDTDWLIREPLMKRKTRLHEVVPDGDGITTIDVVESDFQAFFDELVDTGEEGIIVKRRDSPYHLNTRSQHWRKVKAFTERDVLAVGYTPGEGNRAATFGALVMMDGEQYLGRVGTGFSETEREALLESFEPVEERPVPVQTVGMAYTPIEPVVISVKYQEVTENDELRAPVYLSIKPDAPITDVSALD